jgi:accessory gene regulator B
MFVRISRNISGSMVKNGIVSPSNQELCRYGIQQIFMTLLNVSVTLAIALLMNMLAESVLFMAAYISLRRYAGGYHSRTPLRCCVFSGVMMAVVLSAIRFIEFSAVVCLVVAAISAVVIVLLSPVADANKPLDEVERKVYRRRALIILSVELLIVVGLIASGLADIAACMVLALAALGIMLMLGEINNRLRNL